MEFLLGFQEEHMEKEEEEERPGGYKLVPWINWDEWNFVRESLFSSSPDSIAAALRRVTAWRSRGCLPVVVEVSASIIEIQQKDPFFKGCATNDVSNSEEILAMLYCMAIMRLVNGVVEKTRKRTEVSIAEAADAIGIPRMLIDIRHEGSHRDLPSLQLVRLASMKALEWLKSYYWEPQKNAIPFQRDGIASVRKEIKSKLRELAFYLNAKQSQKSGSPLTKGRRAKQSELLCGSNKFFPCMARKLKSSKSGGSKKQFTKILRNLVRLYSSYPLEVVSLMLDFLLKASDCSNVNEVDSLDNSQVDPNLGSSKPLIGTIVDWKLIIAKFSSKEPELLLIMLKVALEMIDAWEAKKSEIGHHSPKSHCRDEIRKIELLSSLASWLVGKLKEVKHPGCRESATKIQLSSAETDVVSKVTLTELLRKCLLVSIPGNNQLMDAALHLAQMIGKSSLVGKLEKLSLLSLPNLDSIDESSTHTCLEEAILLQQEESINQAAEKLELLKLRWMKGKMVNTAPSTDDSKEKENKWTVAKSWNPCPIGMLPCALGSSGVLPIFNRANEEHEVQELLKSTESWEMEQCSGKREVTDDVESLENSSVTKKMKETVEDDGRSGIQSYLSTPVEGRLIIGGVWKKVGEEELHAIKSAVRILV